LKASFFFLYACKSETVRGSVVDKSQWFTATLDRTAESLPWSTSDQGRIKLFGSPRQWKHFRPLFQAVFLSGGGVLPPRQSNTTPPSPKTEITNILF